MPGAEISQSCLWWAWDDRRRPKGGACAHVGSKAPGCKQAFCALSLTYKAASLRRGEVLSTCWCCSKVVDELLRVRDGVQHAMLAPLQVQGRFLTVSLREQPHGATFSP